MDGYGYGSGNGYGYGDGNGYGYGSGNGWKMSEAALVVSERSES